MKWDSFVPNFFTASSANGEKGNDYSNDIRSTYNYISYFAENTGAYTGNITNLYTEWYIVGASTSDNNYNYNYIESASSDRGKVFYWCKSNSV